MWDGAGLEACIKAGSKQAAVQKATGITHLCGMVLQELTMVGTMMTPPPTPTMLPNTPASRPTGPAMRRALASTAGATCCSLPAPVATQRRSCKRAAAAVAAACCAAPALDAG